ncbi:hypothetical protein LDENG_00264330, partial [Lucifuga dentata]
FLIIYLVDSHFDCLYPVFLFFLLFFSTYIKYDFGTELIVLHPQTCCCRPLLFVSDSVFLFQISPEDFNDKDGSFTQHMEEADVDTKLSRLCEQDKACRVQEDKLQQLHREKHTLETALLSASQELSEQGGSAPQSLIQQRDVLHNGLLSTCRELSRVHAELERSWREYDRLEADVTLAKSNLLEQLEALGSPQTEPPSQRHIQIQKELWRIQDVMEVLSKNKAQRIVNAGFPGSKPLSSLQKNEQAPDYRLYKSEPELTTVKEEVDEANGEDKTDPADGKETAASKVPSYPVGIIPPRTKSPLSPPESSTIASYVTLRKTKKPETRSDRPRSAVDQVGFVEREVGRARMSVEEQLERMRRNQEATSLREKKRETPSRSPSFSRDNSCVTIQSRDQVDSSCVDQDSSLQQEVQKVEQVNTGQDTGQDMDTDAITQENMKLGESKRVMLLDVVVASGCVEIVDLQPFEDDESREQNLTTSSPTNTTTENSLQTPEPNTPSPEPKEDEQQAEPEESSYNQKHNNNMLTSQTFTLNSNT